MVQLVERAMELVLVPVELDPRAPDGEEEMLVLLWLGTSLLGVRRRNSRI
jgi:hypothetical protein